MYKEDLALYNLQWLMCHKNQTKPNHIYFIDMYKKDFALHNLQRLIIHKTQQNQPNESYVVNYSLHKYTV